MGQYMSRAEYIKKTVLDKPSEPTGGSGSGAGASDAATPYATASHECVAQAEDERTQLCAMAVLRT